MMSLTVAFLAGLLPTLLYVLAVWWLDRYEKEPVALLVLAFLWGAVPAALLSLIVELLFAIPVGTALGTDTLAADLLSASVSAPLVEESLKGIALIGLVIFFRMEFDDALDGIIYGAMIGFGFAFTENVFSYFLPILSEEGIRTGMVNILMRSIVFGGNHALWSGITGAAIGYARWLPSWRQRILVPSAGWLLAVLLHAIHNAGATLAQQIGCLSLGISLAVDWGGLLLLSIVAALILRKESRWIEDELAHEVQLGVLSSQEYELLKSARKRMWVRWRSRSRGGSEAYRAVGSYFQSATELAFLKHHLRAQSHQGDNRTRVERLRLELVSRRTLALPWL
jgi:RsiW-degrading membrane proteinase PrsW (M82 family)